MGNNRSSQIIAIVALVVAVVGVSIGFAAFSRTLNVSATANVKPNDDFNVRFSATNTSFSQDNVDGVLSTQNVAGFSAAPAEITDLKVSGITANFTAPGQSVTYTFYVNNNSDYIAYLNDVVFNNAASATTHKKCTAGTGTDQTKVDVACADITYTIKLANSDTYKYVDTTNDIGKELAAGGFETVEVKIEYVSKSNQTKADGDFNVSFGDVELQYSTISATN